MDRRDRDFLEPRRLLLLVFAESFKSRLEGCSIRAGDFLGNRFSAKLSTASGPTDSSFALLVKGGEVVLGGVVFGGVVLGGVVLGGVVLCGVVPVGVVLSGVVHGGVVLEGDVLGGVVLGCCSDGDVSER